MQNDNDGRLNTSEERALLQMRDAPALTGCLDALESVLKQYVHIDGYAINLYRASDDCLVCVRVHLPASSSGLEQTFANMVLPLDSPNMSARVFESRMPTGITSNNLEDYPPVTRVAFDGWGMKHMVVLPIQVTGANRRPVGTLMLFSQHGSVAPSLLRRITRVIEEAAALLRLHQTIASWEARAEAMRKQEEDLQSVLDFIANMSQLSTEQELYPRIEREFLSRFDLDMAGVLLSDGEKLRCVDTMLGIEGIPWESRWKQHCQQLSYSVTQPEGASTHAFQYNQPLLFGDIPAILDVAMPEKDRTNLDILEGLQTFAILPIRKQGVPVGLLWLGSLQRKEALTPEQIVLARHLCDFLGAIIENAQAYSRLTGHHSQQISPVGVL
ncbi:MAG: diguanylate cyclase [Proteobacteria bacterium]|nr:diguanylate cyclase [Pseudomonadota bacterium]